MILTQAKIGTLMYYSNLLFDWQCYVSLRDRDDNDLHIDQVFKISTSKTKFDCKFIYVRSYYSGTAMMCFRSFALFINTFRILHSLHVFQMDNVKFK